MDQEKIGKFILECRKKKKLTQIELAETLGVSDKSVSNWENGRNMPDLSLFKPICEVLDITINDLISGEMVSEDKYQEKLEENIISTIDYTNKKIIRKNNLIGIILVIFGVLVTMSAMTIFPSESSWGSIYSLFGAIISMVGISYFTRKFKFLKRILLNLGYLVLFIMMLFLIDYVSVVNIGEAPRFVVYKITGDTTIYYDTILYDVVRCNRDSSYEYYKIMPNQKYDKNNISLYCDSK